MIWPSAVTFVNGKVAAGDGIAHSMRFASRILALGEQPRRGDTVIDLDGAFVLPGLVNAHDHLELNHYGRLKWRDRYENASEWIDDMRPRLATDAGIRAGRSHPLADRLFIGALKNLLAGVTLVAHHNPFYRELRHGMPIRVLRRYGWAHSFALERESAGARGEPGGQIAERWRRAARSRPFFVHIAEGVDMAACHELRRLDASGCLEANTVIVHGVGIDREGWRRIGSTGAGLAWCPASNLFLFNRTVDIRSLIGANGNRPGRIALGTDSRLTGARDLLDELRAARGAASISAAELLAMVTRAAADLLRQPLSGRIAVGLPADLVVIPPGATNPADALLETRRADIGLVVLAGRPVVGQRRFAPLFAARRTRPRFLCIDGSRKLAAAALVRRIACSPIGEPGVTAG